jgi:hypothetical protein
MADTSQRAGRASGDRSYDVERTSGWTGWVVFAGVIMVMIGALHGITGLVALFDDGYYVVRPSGLVLNVDYTGWGWAHLLGGIIIFAAGCGVIAGQTWARAVGVVLAVVSVVGNMLFFAAYPFWSLILITLDVIVIYALIVHGRELKRP